MIFRYIETRKLLIVNEKWNELHFSPQFRGAAFTIKIVNGKKTKSVLSVQFYITLIGIVFSSVSMLFKLKTGLVWGDFFV